MHLPYFYQRPVLTLNVVVISVRPQQCADPSDPGTTAMIIYYGPASYIFHFWARRVIDEDEDKTANLSCQNYFTPIEVESGLRQRRNILGVSHPIGDESAQWVIFDELWQSSPDTKRWLTLPQRGGWVHHYRGVSEQQYGIDQATKLRNFSSFVADIEAKWAGKTLTLNGVAEEDIKFNVIRKMITNDEDGLSVKQCGTAIGNMKAVHQKKRIESQQQRPGRFSYSSPPSSRVAHFHPMSAPATPPFSSNSSSTSSSSSSSFSSPYQARRR